MTRKRLAWFAIGLGAATGLYWGGLRLSGLSASLIAALAMVCAGLLVLFPLAAFGPKTEQQGAVRVRTAAVGTFQVLVGLALTMSASPLKIAIECLSILLLCGALIEIPKRLFRPEAGTRNGG